MQVVRASFKPEFLNRLDDVVMFDALDREELARIVSLQIAAVADRLKDRRIRLDVDDASTTWLAAEGFDPLYGARPLKRLVQKEIGDALARLILTGAVHDDDTVLVRTAEDGTSLVLSVPDHDAPEAAAATR